MVFVIHDYVSIILPAVCPVVQVLCLLVSTCGLLCTCFCSSCAGGHLSPECSWQVKIMNAYSMAVGGSVTHQTRIGMHWQVITARGLAVDWFFFGKRLQGLWRASVVFNSVVNATMALFMCSRAIARMRLAS